MTLAKFGVRFCNNAEEGMFTYKLIVNCLVCIATVWGRFCNTAEGMFTCYMLTAVASSV